MTLTRWKWRGMLDQASWTHCSVYMWWLLAINTAFHSYFASVIRSWFNLISPDHWTICFPQSNNTAVLPVTHSLTAVQSDSTIRGTDSLLGFLKDLRIPKLIWEFFKVMAVISHELLTVSPIYTKTFTSPQDLPPILMLRLKDTNTLKIK